MWQRRKLSSFFFGSEVIPRWPCCLWLLAAFCFLVWETGCVRRRLTIRSDPPGAMVYVDQRQIGTTPVSTPFTYYGTRNFVVTKDGFETVQASRMFRPPWYQWPVLDFITENLWPVELRDERIVEFQLAPKATVSTEKLIRRAEELRSSAAQGIASPLPSVTRQQPTSETMTLPAPTIPTGSGPSVPTVPNRPLPNPGTAPPVIRPPSTPAPSSSSILQRDG